MLRDPALKFHLEKTGKNAYFLHTLKHHGGDVQTENLGK
jgi:hypothetical protein